MASSGYCRLCAELKLYLNLIPINKSEDGFSTNLYYKISQCFQIQIEFEDNLPKTICFDCCTQTNLTYDFYQKVHQAQDVLRNMLQNTLVKNEYYAAASPVEPEDNWIVKTKVEDDANTSEGNNDASSKVDDEQWSETDNKSIETLRVSNDVGPKERKKSAKQKKKQKQKTKQSQSPTKSHQVMKKKQVKIKKESYIKLLEKFEEEWKDYVWRCHICKIDHKTKKELNEHFKQMHNKAAEYICIDCSKIFAKFQLFKRHVRRHASITKFCCDVCGKVYKDRWVLHKHKLRVHEQAHIAKYVCNVCGKIYKWASSLQNHTLNFHVPDDKKLECDVCHKIIGSEKSLIHHKQLHDESTKKFTCDQCGLGFRRNTYLKEHIKMNHIVYNEDEYLQCPICPKKLKHEILLRRHKREVHCAEKRYACETCGKKFSLLTQYKRHCMLHTGERPYKCEHCDKCFRIREQLKVHNRQHTGEKPYCCSECNHYFTDLANYIKHMSKKHGVTSFKNVKKVTDGKSGIRKS